MARGTFGKRGILDAVTDELAKRGPQGMSGPRQRRDVPAPDAIGGTIPRAVARHQTVRRAGVFDPGPIGRVERPDPSDASRQGNFQRELGMNRRLGPRRSPGRGPA